MHGSGDHAHAVASHYNRLEEAGRDQRTRSRIFYLRNFNNWVKSVLIGEALNRLREKDSKRQLSVLDLCSGKGGDLLKWKKGRIDYLVCADIAATSVEQSESRYKENVQRERHQMYGAEFIVADCTKERLRDKFKDREQKFDLVSCQFSFHYCFESFSQALMMLRNAAENLRVGGCFIGTIPNANELVRRLREGEGNKFGNDVFSIEFSQQEKKSFALFGARYHFQLEGVVDCPEFLVYFPVLERLARLFGLQLVKKEPFAKYFNENINNREHLNLLSGMQALEPYPAFEGTEQVSSKAEDYAMAQQFLASLKESQGGGDCKIGTLTQAEWEAATLYQVFVFEKIEDVCPPLLAPSSTTESVGVAPYSSADST